MRHLLFSLFFITLIFRASAQGNGPVQPIDTGKIYATAEQMPQFPGGKDSLNKHVVYYLANNDSDKEGTVYVNFVVNKTGEITNPKVIMGMKKFPQNDSIALATVQQMPRWNPGMQGGTPVNVMCNLPVRFKRIKIAANKNDDEIKPRYFVFEGDTIYTIVSQMPKLPGTNLYDYIQAHIEYPATEKAKNISGTVFVKFIVEKDGTVSNIKVTQGVEDGAGLEQEAVKLIFTTPKWDPGILNGKPVKVQMTFPISFSLTGNKHLRYRDSDSTYVDYSNTDHDSVYDKPDKMPEFKGEIHKYIYDNIEIPQKEKREGIHGFAAISFIVEKDGSLNYIRVIDGVIKGPGIDKSALSVVASMPKWNPGMLNGKPVRVRYVLYIGFYMRKNQMVPLMQDRR